MYTQCLLKRSKVSQMCWIESQYAEKDLILEDTDGTLWKVVEVYSSVDSEQLQLQRKTQREFKGKLK